MAGFRGAKGRGSNDSKVIPTEAGIHAALTEDERVVVRTASNFPARQRRQVS